MTSGDTEYDVEYAKSDLYTKTKEALARCTANPDPGKKIHYEDEFAASSGTRLRLTNTRLTTIYWRSPNYNLSRIMVSAVIAVILSSVLVQERWNTVFSETQMRAQFAVIFLSFIIVGIMSIFSVLPVMLSIRDMFHRHRAAGMIGSGSLCWALGVAEKGFIVASSVIFVAIFLTISFVSGSQSLRGRIEFWVSQSIRNLARQRCPLSFFCSLLYSLEHKGFFTFNLALYSYFGQAFVCFFKPMATAQILASVFIGLNNFFSGLIVRPQFMVGLFAITYWITPGHFVYEGMITSLYSGDDRAVIADSGSDFYNYLNCAALNTTVACEGTVNDYMDSFFGGKFQKSHSAQNLIILGAMLVCARGMTYLALHYINFSAT
jgi:hypothetical protein